MRGYRRNAATRMVQIARATDDLSGITALTNGYWWHARNASGIGTAAFKVPESGGHTTFDLVQATVASQPTVLTENGSTQFRMRKATDPSPSLSVKTAGNVQAGWTGPTYVGGWFRIPDNSGHISAAGDKLFAHFFPVGVTRRIDITLTTSAGVDQIVIQTSATGAAENSNITRGVYPPGDLWAYVEVIFDPLLTLGGNAPAEVIKVFCNLMRTTMGITVPTTAPASLADANTNIVVGSFLSAANGDTTDWAACYYCNGIPSVGDRRRMAGYYPPRTITF